MASTRSRLCVATRPLGRSSRRARRILTQRSSYALPGPPECARLDTRARAASRAEWNPTAAAPIGEPSRRNPSPSQRSIDVSPTTDCARLYQRAVAFTIAGLPPGEPGVAIDEATQTGVAFEQVMPDAGPF